jgi:hypothetical protein
MENNQDMQQPQAVIEETGIKLPKDSKANRYYYRNRDKILERRREIRMQKKEQEGLLTKEQKAEIKKNALLGKKSEACENIPGEQNRHT